MVFVVEFFFIILIFKNRKNLLIFVEECFFRIKFDYYFVYILIVEKIEINWYVLEEVMFCYYYVYRMVIVINWEMFNYGDKLFIVWFYLIEI